MNLHIQISELQEKIRKLEDLVNDSYGASKKIARSEIQKSHIIQNQAENMNGLFMALCVSTIDPLKQGRIKFFSPLFHENETQMESLDWAYVMSPFGGIDDSGVSWIPPAGSTVCILFQNAHRRMPICIGSIWCRDKGPDNANDWNYTIKEYDENFTGRGDSYIIGKKDGSQFLPPWNTENYNGIDIDSIDDFENDSDAQKKITYPHIYGYKTPGKHYIKHIDGDRKCKSRWARSEWGTPTGNIILMKDDHMHPCGQWAHPDCGCGGGDVSDCENNEVEDCTKTNCETNKCANPYFKHKNECRIHKGPQTPQNNKCKLCQSGIQFLSVSGHTFFMDDSVEEPRGEPNWEKGTKPFDFGCNDKYIGKMGFTSATGHSIELNDEEEDTNLRSENNGIKILTACGNKIELNDHTKGEKDQDCPPNIAGEKRGIHIQSTSEHSFVMIDEDNDQCSPKRKEGGVPNAQSKKAYTKWRSGYGLEIALNDDFKQKIDGEYETDQQHIRIFCPQYKNEERGPHLIQLQETPTGPGYMLQKIGGDFYSFTYDNHMTVVGDEEKNPSNKIVNVSKDYIEKTKDNYVNLAKQHIFIADEKILLGAGKDCEGTNGESAPCFYPVLCMGPKGVTVSDRVLVSASSGAACVNITQLVPFHKCN